MSMILEDSLIEHRARLVVAVHATYREELWKGSDAWRRHQAAKRALDQFDLDHPGVVMELYARFEEYQAKGVSLCGIEDGQLSIGRLGHNIGKQNGMG